MAIVNRSYAWENFADVAGGIMIDRNTDIVLLAGLPDRAMAEKTLEHARDLRQSRSLTERDGAVGEVLNRIVPILAHKLGVPISDHEKRVIQEHDAKTSSQQMSPAEKVEDMSKTIMFSLHAGRKMFPESALFSSPEQGNLSAVMLDRVLRQEGIAQATRPDGSLEPYPVPIGAKYEVSGVTGSNAVGTHAIAKHLLEKTKEMGHHPVPYWSPGHLLPPREGGMFDKMLSPESRLEISARQVYAERINKLPDQELAAELVEQAREMRERRPELAYQESGYHRYMVWHGIPEMGILYGQNMQDKEIDPHPVKRENDQQAFDSMSSAVMHGIGEGQIYVLRNVDREADHEAPSLSEKVMFNDPTSGNSMGMLLDRVAATLEVERGNEFDRMGRAIAEVARYRDPSVGGEAYRWTPRLDDEVSLRRSPEATKSAEDPALEDKSRKPAAGAMAAAFAAAGIGR